MNVHTYIAKNYYIKKISISNFSYIHTVLFTLEFICYLSELDCIGNSIKK